VTGELEIDTRGHRAGDRARVMREQHHRKLGPATRNRGVDILTLVQRRITGSEAAS
jgi:hypothetical protein